MRLIHQTQMKSIIVNIKTFVIALTGLIGGSIWAVNSNWEEEPLILIALSLIEIIAYIILRFITRKDTESISPQTINKQVISNNGKVKKQINIQNNNGKIEM